MIQRAERAILLTGTPALARPKELFNQISALLPAAKLKMKDYGERYCAGGNSKFDKYCGAASTPLCRSHIDMAELAFCGGCEIRSVPCLCHDLHTRFAVVLSRVLAVADVPHARRSCKTTLDCILGDYCSDSLSNPP